MTVLFIFSILGCFILSIFINALRSLSLTKSESAEKLVKHFLWYFPLHKWLFKTEETSTLLVAASTTRFILQFISIACGIQLINGLKEAILFFIVIWLLTDFIPRVIGIKFSKNSLKLTSGAVSLFLLINLPFNLVILNLPKKLIKPIFDRESPETDLRDVLENVKRKALIDSHNKKLIEAVVTFKDRIAREVMVPRIRVFALDDSLSILDASKLLLSEGYSRVPVYKGTIDTITGVLMYKDILILFYQSLVDDKKKYVLNDPISTLVKPVIYTPETKNISHLLQDFKSKQMHLAIVVDEYGGTEGIVTIEDIIEEIVGDISDEYDSQTDHLFVDEPSGSWIVDAKMSILDVEEYCSIKIPVEGDFDTIGGFIFQRSGTIPKKGFRIYLDDFDLEVLSSTDRTIGKVRIIPNDFLKNSHLKTKTIRNES
jgi:putative hemolysin